MATTVTKSIGSAGGRDYATIQAFLDAVAVVGNLVTADQIWIGELYNDSEFLVSGGTIGHLANGITTDATRYILIRPATGQGFKDHATAATNPHRYDQSKGVGLRITNSYSKLWDVESALRVDGVQMYYNSTYSSNYYPPIHAHGIAAVLTLSNFILEFDRTGGKVVLLGASATLVNGIIVSRGATFSGTALVPEAATIVYDNLTVVRPSDLTAATGLAFDAGGQSGQVVKNCAVFGFTTPFTGTFDAASGNNASSVAGGSIPGSSNQASLTYASQFTGTADATRDWRPAAAGALPNHGSRQQTYTNDLDLIAVARSITTPTIGAKEYVVAGPPPPAVLFRRGATFVNDDLILI